jgi:heat shock protein HspQ
MRGRVWAGLDAALRGFPTRKPAPTAVTGRPEMTIRFAKFQIGDVVKHRIYPFRGVIFDVDPEFANSEEWWQSIPEEVRPRKDQPFYHLLAENADTTYIAYVSEQNLLPDNTGEPCRHPQLKDMFTGREDGRYQPRHVQAN